MNVKERNAVLEEAATVCDEIAASIYSKQHVMFVWKAAASIRALKTPEPVFDEWIEWKGGECPVEKETIVEVKFRDRVKSANHSAAYWEWRHVYGQSDIIAYRVVTP